MYHVKRRTVMSAKRNPTLLKSIRITESTNDLLKKDAAVKRTTTNALIQSILTKYLEWDRQAQRYGFISLTHDTFKTILDKIDEQKLVDASRELGARVPKDIILFWYGKTGVQGFLKYISLLSDYATFAQFEIARDGQNYIVTAHHNFGLKWSNYLKSFLETGLKSTTGIDGSTEVSRNSVALTFFTG
jgi:hypothetical protein